MNHLRTFFHRRDYLVVGCLWLLFETIWFLKFGVMFKMEATKYINEAGFILEHGHLSQGRYLFYLLTILIIAASFLLKTGVQGALIAILVINLFSYLYFFKALKKTFGSPWPALVVIFFLLYFWPYQVWSLFLYTECLFYSLVMLLFARLLLFERLDLRFTSSVLLILLAVILTRPLGILFIFPVLLFFYFHLNRRQRMFFYGGLVLAIFLLGWIVQVVFTTTPDWNMQRAFLEESIICDMPVNTANKQLDISTHPNQLYRLGYYLAHNFSHFAGLALVRLKYFFLLTRPYYSSLHNAYVLTHVLLLYVLIVAGFMNLRRQLPVAVNAFIFSSLFFFAIAVAFQCDDYHSRFFLTLVPLLAVAAVAACWPFLRARVSFFSAQDKG